MPARLNAPRLWITVILCVALAVAARSGASADAGTAPPRHPVPTPTL